MSNRYRLITGLSAAVVIVAVLLCCCFVSFNNINDVFAFTTSNITSGAVDVGDILLEGYADRADGKVFNGESMAALYAKLTGSAAKNDISDVDNLLQDIEAVTAADIRAKNGNKDIVLTMDGQKWTVAHLTKDRTGNTIATLWLANASEWSKWNLWSYWDTNVDYPSNMYSSSYMRANYLNSGSSYVATQGATVLTKIAQSPTHQYARLTMPSVKGALTDFIVTPAQVAYQETENNTVGGSIGNLGYTLPNEAYGTPSGTVNWYNASGRNTDYSGKIGYADWKDDYIWLPSLTETGYNGSVTGIWDLSGNQRSNIRSSWVRSGYYSNASLVCFLRSNDYGDVSTDMSSSPSTVRPALHLNLTKAAEHSGGVALAEPTDVTLEYNGNSLTIDDVAAEQKEWYKQKLRQTSQPMDLLLRVLPIHQQARAIR